MVCVVFIRRDTMDQENVYDMCLVVTMPVILLIMAMLAAVLSFLLLCPARPCV